MNEIPTRYSPQDTEDKWYKLWEENNLFSGIPNPAKKPFSIVIPPPNVTGILHMGHALNNTIQDILIRYHRMKGEETLWMPGTDHAGIATQNVVEKTIAKEGLKRQDLGREKFIARVWEWKEQYGSTIIRQLKKLGSSCDWSRTRFTMDEEYSKAVIEVFVRLYQKDLIYRGSYIINWCPRCQTALADEEAPHRELNGNLYYIKYPLKESTVSSPQTTDKTKSVDRGLSTVDHIVVATTRPETMLGDTAVAVNPKDKRYKKLIGISLVLPLVNREIKIIADSMVDMKFGTGAVKVTPAHDPNDYVLGKKHNLEFVNVMHPDGRMNHNALDYEGMDRFEAREVILEDLKEKNLLEKIEPHQLSAGHCYRCHTIIEPYLSKQWFVRMKPLAKPAIAAVKKVKIKFHPPRWTKVYLNWMENIQDWCISRQIWWGHRLPVYYCKECMRQLEQSTVHSPQSTVETKTTDYGLPATDYKGVIVSRVKPDKCPECGSSDIYQDEDVLDTWFSSWLWPFATFGWPNQLSVDSCQLSDKNNLKTENRQLKTDLEYFYPTSVLVTAPEIIFFWVARMIMAGFEFMDNIPFSDVYIHGTVRDIEGKKMSKSLGNIIDPLDIIKEYGTDALRFSLISITAQGQDVYLSKERFEQGRNFANKIWNAARFIMMNLETGNINAQSGDEFAKDKLDVINGWILSRFYSVIKETTTMLDTYHFNEAANNLYSFFWHEFCDWYLEMVKSEIKNKENQQVMYMILVEYLKALHPFMPFISEELWQRLNPYSKAPAAAFNSIMLQAYPHLKERLTCKKIEARMGVFFEVITLARNMRLELEIPLQQEIKLVISAANKEIKELLDSLSGQIRDLVKVSELLIREKYVPIKPSITTVIKDVHITMPFEGVVDIEKERKKVQERIQKTKSEINGKERMLANKEFVNKAPLDVVEKEKSRLKELNEILNRLVAISHEIS